MTRSPASPTPRPKPSSARFAVGIAVRVATWAFCAITFLVSGCAVAPIVQEAGSLSLDTSDLPSDAELVELSAADGVTLRGLFVPAGTGAPVVLHLLPSQASITSGVALGGVVGGMRGTLVTLRDAGFASLAVDYRGVGASSGERDPTQLDNDARAMWSEAVRRADGHPARVLVRSASIGCLAAATLLDGGAEPGGVVWIAPVRAETIAAHGARARHGRWLGPLLTLFLRDPVDVDLVGVLGEAAAPMLVILPERDVYLPEDEARLVEQAALAHNRVVVAMGSHDSLVLRAWGFELDEETFSGRVVGELIAAERAFLAEFQRRATGSDARGPAHDEQSFGAP